MVVDCRFNNGQTSRIFHAGYKNTPSCVDDKITKYQYSDFLMLYMAVGKNHCIPTGISYNGRYSSQPKEFITMKKLSLMV